MNSVADGLIVASASQLQLKQLGPVQDINKIHSWLYKVLVQQEKTQVPGKLKVIYGILMLPYYPISYRLHTVTQIPSYCWK